MTDVLTSGEALGVSLAFAIWVGSSDRDGMN